MAALLSHLLGRSEGEISLRLSSAVAAAPLSRFDVWHHLTLNNCVRQLQLDRSFGAAGTFDTTLHLALFDAFYEFLPDGTELRGDAAIAGFPFFSLNQIVALDRAPWAIRKDTSGPRLLSDGHERPLSARGGAPVETQVGGLRVLLAPSEWALDSLAYAESATVSVNPHCLAQVQGASKLLRATGFSSSDLEFWQPVLVPIREDPTCHRSFSSRWLPGAVFLALNHSTLAVAEAIIHELAHSRLELFCCFYGMLPDNGHLYASPWRADLRPLPGIIHGIVAFDAVCDFLSRYTTLFSSDFHAQFRYQKTALQLMRALEVVESTPLDVWLQDLLSTIRLKSEGRLAAIGTPSRDALAQIDDHYDRVQLHLRQHNS